MVAIQWYPHLLPCLSHFVALECSHQSSRTLHCGALDTSAEVGDRTFLPVRLSVTIVPFAHGELKPAD